MKAKILTFLAEQTTFIAVVTAMAASVLVEEQPFWVGVLVGLAILAVHEIGHQRMRRYRKERDKYQQVAIELAHQWPADDRADALDWLPYDVLAAAIPLYSVTIPSGEETQAGESDG